MPLKPSRRLPRKFSRSVTPKTRAFVERRHQRKKQWKHERWRRWLRRAERVRQEWMKTLRRWLIFFIAGLVILILGLILFSPIAEVREIRIQRTSTRIDLERTSKLLAPLFGRRMLFLSTYDASILLQNALPDLEQLTLTKQYPATLSVRLAFHPLIAKLRIETPQGVQIAAGTGATARGSGVVIPPQNMNDYLTDNGIYIQLPSSVSGSSLPTMRIVDWAVRPIPNTVLVRPDMLEAMHAAETALQQNFNIKMQSRTVYLRAREFHLNSPKVSLWFDLASPLDAQLSRLRTFMDTVGLLTATSYVDLRLAGRVVYR